MAGSTAEYYRSHPEARRKRLKQQARYAKKNKRQKIRVNANKLNRKLGTYGNGDGKDAAHYKGVLRKAEPSLHLLIVKADLNLVNDPTTT